MKESKRIMGVEKKTIRSDIPGSDSYIDKASSKEDHKLTVGTGISLSGEIGSCEHLVVEGYLQASLKDAARMNIKATGHVNGKIEVDEAEISGYFEGDLLVRGRLFIRSTACVAGNVEYGTLQVEPGAAIIGNLVVLQSDNAETNDMNETYQVNTQAERNVTALFEDKEAFDVAQMEHFNVGVRA